MARHKAEEYIPKDVLEAAKRAGLKTPLWYVGRSAVRSRGTTPEVDIDEIFAQAYADEPEDVQRRALSDFVYEKFYGENKEDIEE